MGRARNSNAAVSYGGFESTLGARRGVPSEAWVAGDGDADPFTNLIGQARAGESDVQFETTFGAARATGCAPEPASPELAAPSTGGEPATPTAGSEAAAPAADGFTELLGEGRGATSAQQNAETAPAQAQADQPPDATRREPSARAADIQATFSPQARRRKMLDWIADAAPQFPMLKPSGTSAPSARWVMLVRGTDGRRYEAGRGRTSRELGALADQVTLKPVGDCAVVFIDEPVDACAVRWNPQQWETLTLRTDDSGGAVLSSAQLDRLALDEVLWNVHEPDPAAPTRTRMPAGGLAAGRRGDPAASESFESVQAMAATGLRLVAQHTKGSPLQARVAGALDGIHTAADIEALDDNQASNLGQILTTALLRADILTDHEELAIRSLLDAVRQSRRSAAS